jgi:MoxR-like ATPase
MSSLCPEPTLSESEVELLRRLPKQLEAVVAELGKRIIGQREPIRDLLVTLLARGHCLMVGVPGLAKTLLVRTLSEILDLEFHRIQFTPDLMPSDITGSEILDESAGGGRSFRFLPGPLFTQFLLADEINRTPPKTQAALLEAMQERRVTVAGRTHVLKEPFFVLATQNPIEQEGTYPLPEAQLDRFMFCLNIGYPSRDEEVEILLRTTTGDHPALAKVLAGPDIVALQRAVRQVPVPRTVAEKAVALVQATRPDHPSASESVKRYVQWGAGPRASQYLALAGKARAVLEGRLNVATEDILGAAKLALRHRILTNYRAEADRVSVEQIIDDLVRGARK